MGNKREIKKAVRYACGDVAAECILARDYIDGIDYDAMNAIICDIADLQVDTLACCTFSFDKTERDFENGAQYRKALHNYRRAAFDKINRDFDASLREIVKRMNALLPQEVKDANKLL